MGATFRLMASGDLHWDEHRRFDECVRVHRFIAEEVARQQPDAFVIPGDIYERASTPVERAGVAEWITAVADTCPVLIAKGNHDRHRDLELIGRLRTRHTVIVEERAGVHRIPSRDGRTTAAIGAVAWPDTAVLAAIMGRPLPSQALDDIAREALRNVLLGIGWELSQHDGPRILMGHFMADGATTNVGQPLIGQALNVGLSDIALSCADLVLMAHIHKPQEWQFGDMQVLYTGSPYRTTYGETEQKSVVLAELDGVRGVTWSRVPTPARQMLLLEDSWLGEGRWERGILDAPMRAGCEEPAAESPAGAEIRFRYTVDADRRDAAKREADAFRAWALVAGAVDVKVEAEVRPKLRAKAPEIARADSLADKLQALWSARGTTPPPDRAAALLKKMGVLESEVAR